MASDRNLHDLSGADQARLARAMMRKQGALSLRVAAAFLVLILGLPLVNYYLPEWANRPVGGFTATWLFLAVLIYPVTVALSFAFVSASNRIEARCADWRAILAEEEAR